MESTLVSAKDRGIAMMSKLHFECGKIHTVKHINDVRHIYLLHLPLRDTYGFQEVDEDTISWLCGAETSLYGCSIVVLLFWDCITQTHKKKLKKLSN